MSIGNLKDSGNQGNNFPWQLKMLQGLEAIVNGLNSITVNFPTTPVNVQLPITSTDAFGRQRVSEPYTLFDSSHRYGDNGLWATSTSNGSATFNANQGLVDLAINTNTASYVKRETYKVFSYQPGKSLLLLNTFVMEFFGPSSLIQRVGYYGDKNGFYFERSNNKNYFVKRSNVSGAVVNTPVVQNDWNYDRLDGNGPSGITLDISKAQILWTDMEWLGVGSVRMGFVINGEFILCHTFQHANIINSTYITTACLPLTYEIIFPGGIAFGTTPTLKQICSSVITEGGYELRGYSKTIGIPITTPRTLSAAGTYYPIISIRLKSTNLDGIVIPTGLSILPQDSGNYAFQLISGGATSGGAWIDAGSDSSVEYNITGSSFTGGTIEQMGYFAQTNQGKTPIAEGKDSFFQYQLQRNSFTSTALEFTLVVAAETVGGGGNQVWAALDWQEISR